MPRICTPASCTAPIIVSFTLSKKSLPVTGFATSFDCTCDKSQLGHTRNTFKCVCSYLDVRENRKQQDKHEYELHFGVFIDFTFKFLIDCEHLKLAFN